MQQAREAFEFILRSKGRDVPNWGGKRYASTNIQTYWRWFSMGWALRGSK